MDLFQTSDKRINDGIEGFGHSATATNFNVNSIDAPASAAPGASAIVGVPSAHVFRKTNSAH